jgi:HlyD family secretion protein
MQRKPWIAGALVLALAAAGIGGWLHWRGGAEAVQYRTAKIERGPLQATVAASGTVAPVTQVQIGTQVSGQIKELYADFNSEVKAGQLIAQLDPDTYQQRLRQVQADLDAARASVLTAQANLLAAQAAASRAAVDAAEAERNFRRNEELVAQNFVSPATLETLRATAASLAEARKAAAAQVDVARAQIANAQAAVKQREALVAQADIDLKRTQIRSPVDGVVIKRSIELGQTVAASLQSPELFVIAQNLSDMQVQVSIDEADVSRVRLGQKATFTVDAFGARNFEGEVTQVRKAATNTQNVITYIAIVSFANAESRLLPGMTANVRLVTDTRDHALKVPNAALRVRLAGVVEPAAAPASGAASRAVSSALQRAVEGALPSAVAQPAEGGPVGTEGSGGGAAGGGGSGGPLAQFRARLLAEVQPTPEQLATIDAIMRDARPKFAEARAQPEEQRAKARDRVLAEMRARIGEQLTPEQQPRWQALLAELAGRQVGRGRIYLLGDDGRPRAVAVRLGISDGAMTELLPMPAASGVVEGATVVVGTVAAPSRSSGPRMF